MQLRSVIDAAMLLTPGVAAAQMPLPSFEPAPPLNGLYIGAGVGLNWLQNEHLIGTQGTALNGAISSHLGMVGVASVGYAVPYIGLRVELEGDLRNNPVNSAHDLGFPAIPGGSASMGRWSISSTISATYFRSPISPPMSAWASAGNGRVCRGST